MQRKSTNLNLDGIKSIQFEEGLQDREKNGGLIREEDDQIEMYQTARTLDEQQIQIKESKPKR